MPFLEHLEELRWRLFKIALALAIGIGVSFALIFSKQIDVVAILSEPIRPYITGKLIVTHPGDLFDIAMDAAITLGLIAASPVIVWQIWGFLSPALYTHEKKVVIPSLVGAALLFLMGMTLAFKYVIPVTLQFFASFQSGVVEIMPTVKDYMGFVISMCLAFGAVFELPVVIALLSALGIVQPQYLSKFRRHAAVGCLVAAAIITPGSDPTSLLLLTIPLYGLYEVSISVSRLIARRRERSLAAEVA
ncbi:MAG: twin-arginine translocase subunit TatC [Gemmatimonas sp.]|nr:twin-arginine translocase subunit TatC [Gemmatimonas sp.]MCA2985228.1 twin-arginine translocase subunit TatC [Gemmatimonas sp.]MCA2986867.1 twin-arginine translocase subunit TatC [Gemmatimonas sp.]MCA2994008.1 twin-arginine translocase subunit TatC [Gemmatimonas sp.]MCE2953917.1 twin-arginine translocase subunit TatC [Gemmatimonas sp.]MCZ8013249.1 twin-arginine translocase subunit TatC [Gemmatimonas sp.]